MYDKIHYKKKKKECKHKKDEKKTGKKKKVEGYGRPEKYYEPIQYN